MRTFLPQIDHTSHRLKQEAEATGTSWEGELGLKIPEEFGCASGMGRPQAWI